MEKAAFVFLLLTCLLGLTSQRVLDSHAAEPGPEKDVSEDSVQVAGDAREAPEKTVGAAATGAQEAKPEGDPKPKSAGAEKPDEGKGQKTNPFPVGHKIEVQMHYGVYIVERCAANPEFLTVSLQLPNGTVQPFGFVPMSEVTSMVEEAQSLGGRVSPALLDAQFLSYAFDQQESPVEPSKPDIMATTKLAQQFIQAEAQAEEESRIHGKKHSGGGSEDAEKDDAEEGDEEDGEDDEEEEDEEDEEDEDEGAREEKAAPRSHDKALRGSES